MLAGKNLSDGQARIVHVGQGLDQGEIEAAIATRDHARSIPLPAAPRPTGTGGQAVHDPPADVVARPGVLRPGIPQADDELHEILRTAERGPIPIREGLGRWYRARRRGGRSERSRVAYPS